MTTTDPVSPHEAQLQRDRDRIRARIGRKVWRAGEDGLSRTDLVRFTQPLASHSLDRLLGELMEAGVFVERMDVRKPRGWGGGKPGRPARRYYWSAPQTADDLFPAADGAAVRRGAPAAKATQSARHDALLDRLEKAVGVAERLEAVADRLEKLAAERAT